MLGGIVAYVGFSLAYLWLGQANSDEGWYLYASKLVFLGQVPYRDFAYTQMPLLPYIYGVVQIVQPSLFLGRLTSIFFSVGALGLGILTARKYAGERAGALTALLLASFILGIYFDSIVKTYALVSFFFTATLWVLSTNLKAKIPLAAFFALAAAMVRLPAIFFAAPIILYGLIAAPSRTIRWTLVVECLAVGILAGWFLLPDLQVAQWNLLGSHLSHWGGIPAIDKIGDILSLRFPDISQNYGPILLLFAALFYVAFQNNTTRRFVRGNLAILVVTIGLALFAASHLANGLWATEYLIPAVVTGMPIAAILLSKLYAEQPPDSRIFLQGICVAVFLLLLTSESTQHFDLTGELPLQEIDQVAAFVAQRSQPTDRVLVLQALWVAVDANRPVLPGMTLAQFSFQNADDTQTAERLHVVNYAMLLEDINRGAARIVVLTQGDWNMLSGADPPNAAALQQALAQRYRLALTVPQFGQYAQNVFVYESR